MQKMDRLNGIIMIFCSSTTAELTYDKQDLVNNQFLQMIRDDISRNYQEHYSSYKDAMDKDIMPEKKR
jgi:hypothetical protein